MKKFLLLSLCLFSFVLTANAETYIARKHPAFGKKVINTAPTRMTNPSNLSLMEQALFNKHYASENINSRLNRLEENMFGETKNGTIGERYRNLSGAFDYNRPNPYYNNNRNYYNYYNNPYPMFSPYSTETSRKLGILNRLSNFFGGTVTGVTPGADGFFYDDYSVSPFGKSYYSSNNNFGTGSTVRILD